MNQSKANILLKKTPYLGYFETKLTTVKDKIASFEMEIPKQIKNIATAKANLEEYRLKLLHYKRIQSTLEILISNESFKLKDEQGLNE